jgi:hypothetical protein
MLFLLFRELSLLTFYFSVQWQSWGQCGGGFPTQLILGCRWYALLLTRSVNTQFTLCGALGVTGWLRWPGECSWSRLTALLLGRLLGVLFLTEAGACCSVKPDEARELIRLVPTKVFADLLLLLFTLRLTERATRTAGIVSVNRPEASSLLADWTELRRLLNCLEADPSVNTARNNSCIVAIAGHHGNPVYRAVA